MYLSRFKNVAKWLIDIKNIDSILARGVIFDTTYDVGFKNSAKRVIGRLRVWHLRKTIERRLVRGAVLAN